MEDSIPNNRPEAIKEASHCIFSWFIRKAKKGRVEKRIANNEQENVGEKFRNWSWLLWLGSWYKNEEYYNQNYLEITRTDRIATACRLGTMR